ncbi:uncharacterized protein YALI1_F20885g [Yarrowia lipolytica]|nr:hypothetical protein YALI1_F20885g [Yarrowia lipolytica]
MTRSSPFINNLQREMFNSHLQINVIRSPIGDFSCFSPLTSVLTSYPWTPKTAIAWTGLEEGRFFDLSYSPDHVTNPNVAMLRLNRSTEAAATTKTSTQGVGAASGQISQNTGPCGSYKGSGKAGNNIANDRHMTSSNSHEPNDSTSHGRYGVNNIVSNSISPQNMDTLHRSISPNMTRTTSLILPTPDTTIDQKSEEVEANSEEETENDVEEYMCSVNRVREMYARSYPNISLPPINREDSYQYYRNASVSDGIYSSTPSPTPSPTLPSLTSVLGDLVPRIEGFSDTDGNGYASSDYGGSNGSDSTYSPGSIQSSPEAIYTRDTRGGRPDVIYHHRTTKRDTVQPQSTHQSPTNHESTKLAPTKLTPTNRSLSSAPSSSAQYSFLSASPHSHLPSHSCVAELKNRGLWEEAQKKKRGKLSCSECGKFKHLEKFNNLADLAKHLDQEHQDLSHRLKCPHPECAWGVVGFVSLTEQKRHIKHLHESQPIQCEICFRKLQRQDGYIRHMRDVHGVSATKTDKLPHRNARKVKPDKQ